MSDNRSNAQANRVSPISTVASCPSARWCIPFRDRGFKYGDAAST